MQFCFTKLKGKLSYPCGSSLEYMQYFSVDSWEVGNYAYNFILFRMLFNTLLFTIKQVRYTFTLKKQQQNITN